ncbi:hypothetical protein PQX77_002684 [Marasmius sp. AFHP31]|nr:hypothetical protein PQX77_002684 [Marasmius sp. AFHP31]
MFQELPPKQSFNRSNGNGPPGMASNSLRYALRDDEVALSETTTGTLTLNSLTFGIPEPLISDEEMNEIFEDSPQTEGSLRFESTPRIPLVIVSSDESGDEFAEMPALQDISDTESEPRSEDDQSTSESEDDEYYTAWSHNYGSDSSEEISDPDEPIPNLAEQQDLFGCDYSDYIDEYQIGWAADSGSDEPNEEQPSRSDRQLFGCDYAEYVHEYLEIIKPETQVINPA